MADITNLSSFLGDVADAIRSKKGSEESIPAKKFDEEILSIETGVDTSDADATEENIESGKTAYVNGLKVTGTLADAGGSADIMVSTDNISVGNQRGWDCVSTKYTNSGKKIHKDGWYVNQHMKFEDLAPVLGVTADKIAKGNTILGIEGTAEGGGATTSGVKLFETEEEMRADTTAEEDDLAIVYRSEIQNLTETSVINELSFKNTIVLDTAITSSGSAYLVDENQSYETQCQLRYSSTYFYIRDYYTYEYIVRYTSTDGITYTLDSGYETSYTFNQPMHFRGTWNDVYGKFIQCGGMQFEGLYECSLIASETIFDMKTVDGTNTKPIDISEINAFIKEKVGSSYSAGHYSIMILVKTIELADTKLNTYKPVDYNIFYTPQGQTKYLMMDSTGKCLFVTNAVSTVNTTKYTIKNHVLTDTKQYDVSTSSQAVCYYEGYAKYLIDSDVNANYYTYPGDAEYTAVITTAFPMTANTTVTGSRVSTTPTNFKYLKYIHAQTQLTLNNSNQLLPEQIAYGKNGIIAGDGTIYDNLDYTIINGKYFENPNTTTALSYVGGSTALSKDGYKIKKLIRDNTSLNNFYVYRNINNIDPVASSFNYSYAENTEIVFNNKVYIRNNSSPLDILEIDLTTGEQYNFTPPVTGFTGWASVCINRQAGLLFASSLISGQAAICKYDLLNRTSSVLTTVTTTSKKIEYIGLMGYDEKLDLLYFTTGDIWGNVEPADIYSVNASGTYTKVVTTTLREGYTDPTPLCTDNYIALAIGALDSSVTTYKIYYKAKGETSFKSITGTNIQSQGAEFTNAVAYDNGDGHLLIRVYDGGGKKNYVIKINTTNNTSERIENMDIIPYNMVLGKTDDRLVSIQGVADVDGYNYTKPLYVSRGRFYNYIDYGKNNIQEITVDSSGTHIYDYIPVKTTDLSDTTDGMLIALLYNNGSFRWYSISDLDYNILGNKSVE